MTRPYYDDGTCQIWLGDCRTILPTLPKVDLVLTDPPYGVSGERNSKSTGTGKRNDYGTFIDSVEYVKEVAVPAFITALSKSKRAILTPGNVCLTFYPPPDSFGSFFQPASIGLQKWGRADSQPIFYYGKFPRDSTMIPGQSLSWELTETRERNGHPCPKPFNAWCRLLITGAPLINDRILDPFMGSGTTLVAAKNIGRKCFGIEIEERYCEIAARRLAQEVLPLHAPPAPRLPEPELAI
jgi:DNA modification methylase